MKAYLIGISLAFGINPAAQAQDPVVPERVALLICQCAYPELPAFPDGKLHLGPLITPGNDLVLMKQTLEAAGFKVTVLKDKTVGEMRQGVGTFAAANKGVPAVLFYYSGHGMQVDGTNYLTGIDTDLDLTAEMEKLEEGKAKGFYTAADVEQKVGQLKARTAGERMLPLTDVITTLAGMSTDEGHIKMLFLDACRDPFRANAAETKLLAAKNPLLAKAAQGLASVTVEQPGLFIGFASAANQVANQNEREDSPSLFTEHLCRNLAAPGVPLLTAFNRTANEVRLASRQLVKRHPAGMFFEQFPAQYSVGGIPDFMATKGAAVEIVQVAAGPAGATKERPFENSLGMKFVPAGSKGVMFSIWETRRQDWEAWVADGGGNGNTVWENAEREGVPLGQDQDHPVVCISREDAEGFCLWLTRRERAAGRIGPKDEYRLPTDKEWSAAVGLPSERGETPEAREKEGAESGIYPWGRAWPPPRGAGNYADTAAAARFGADWGVIDGYADGFAGTAPAGSFSGNMFGLFDMGGNVWEWCDDWYNSDKESAVLRGGSWYDDGPVFLRSSCRSLELPSIRSARLGFRVVVVAGGGG